MSVNNLKEIQDKIIKYFSKKGIILILNEYNNLIWNYKNHYSEFTTILYVQKEFFDQYYTITYHVNGANIRTYKKKTKSSSKNFCGIIYKNFINFQKIFDERALDKKNETDLKNIYCTELTRYYSRIHHKISIDIFKLSTNEIDISITGYNQKNRQENYYSIKYKDNKYYLYSKSDYTEKTLVY